MARYLVTFTDQINDVEISGFKLMSEKEVETFESLAENITWTFYYPLTNDIELEFAGGDDLLSKIDFKELSNDEFKVVKKLFNEGFGVFIDVDFLEEQLDDEDEEYEDEDEESNYYDNDNFDDDEY